MSDTMKVDFNAISGLATGIDGQVKSIENQLSDLKQQITNLTAIWEGSANTGFQQVKTNWFNSADDLNSVLNRIATAVHTANDQYQQTESKNASQWG